MGPLARCLGRERLSKAHRAAGVGVDLISHNAAVEGGTNKVTNADPVERHVASVGHQCLVLERVGAVAVVFGVAYEGSEFDPRRFSELKTGVGGTTCLSFQLAGDQRGNGSGIGSSHARAHVIGANVGAGANRCSS